jgi:hypothetical protein
MSAMTYRSILMCGLLLLSARPCLAQTKPAPETPAAATFDKLPEVARPGTKVMVTDSRGNAVVGKIRLITAESVSLKVPSGWGSKTYDVKRDEIQIIRKPGDSSANGAVIGALAGLGGAIGLIWGGDEDSNLLWLFALVPAGGVAGYFVDRAFRDRRLLYAKPSGPSVSVKRSLGGNLGVRADVGLVSPSDHRPAPRVAANIVMSLGSRGRNP